MHKLFAITLRNTDGKRINITRRGQLAVNLALRSYRAAGYTGIAVEVA